MDITAVKALCMARIDRQKNQMMLLEALARHDWLTLRCTGPVTQPDYMEELDARARELGVVERVAFPGALKPASAELVEEYRRADLFLLASRHEPFGIAVLEAWAAGLCVIASDVGGLGRLMAAHPGAAIPFACGDAASLDSALGRFRAMSGEERREMSAAGMAAARQYDWRELSVRLTEFYKAI